MLPHPTIASHAPGASDAVRRRTASAMFAGVLTAASLLANVLTAPIAGAHIDARPERVPAGAAVSVRLAVTHGCTKSATTSMAIKVPSGVVVTKAVAPVGWTATVGSGRVDASGPALAGATQPAVTLSFTSPEKDTVLRFPTVQRCARGQLSWIGAADAKYPAPSVAIGNAATPATSHQH